MCVVLFASQGISRLPIVMVEEQEFLVGFLVGGIARQLRFELGGVFCRSGGAACELGILFNDLLLQMSSRTEIGEGCKAGQKSGAEEPGGGFQPGRSGED